MFLLLVARLLPWIPYKIELPILCPSTSSGRTVFPNVLSEVEGRAHASTSSARTGRSPVSIKLWTDY